MADESTALPTDCIEPTARIMAQRYKGFAVLPFCVGAFFLYGSVSYHVKHGLAHSIFAVVFNLLLTVGVPAWIGVWLLRKARRLARTGKLASSDPSFSWHLTGNLIAAGDSRSVPRPDLAFAITGNLRRSLTAVPRATAVASAPPTA